MTGFPTFTFAGSESYTVTYEEDSGKSYSADDVYFNQEGSRWIPAWWTTTWPT